MPKRKATNPKAVDEEDKKEAEEVAHTAKMAKKTKGAKESTEKEKSPAPTTGRSTRASSKEAAKNSKADKMEVEEDKKKGGKKTEEKVTKGKKDKGKKEEKDEEEEEDEDDEKKETKKEEKAKGKDVKGKKNETKGKKDEKKKDKEEEEEDEEEKEEEKPVKGKGAKAKKDEKEADKKDEKEKKGKKGAKEEEKKGDKEEDEEEEEEEEEDVKKEVKKTAKGGVSVSKKLDRNRSNIDHDIKPSEQVVELGDGKIPGDQIVISSWNVAGLNALLKKKDLHDYMKDRKPDIICLNETKLNEENYKQIGTAWIPEGYTHYFNCCKVKKGYSGTAIVTKYKPLSVKFDLGIKKHDLEGRTITLEFETFYLVACYVPNAGDKLVGLDYRTQEWDRDFRTYLLELKKKKHVILCGDLNCAHKEIDIHKAKGNEKSAGFTPEERKCFGELLDSGFIDTFRHFYPEQQKFSYFSTRFNNRATNKGWRLDYFLIDKDGLVGVKDSLINDKVFGSDHLPIELVLNPQFKK